MVSLPFCLSVAEAEVLAASGNQIQTLRIYFSHYECDASMSSFQQQTFLHETALPSPQATKNLFKKHCNKVRTPPHASTPQILQHHETSWSYQAGLVSLFPFCAFRRDFANRCIFTTCWLRPYREEVSHAYCVIRYLYSKSFLWLVGNLWCYQLARSTLEHRRMALTSGVFSDTPTAAQPGCLRVVTIMNIYDVDTLNQALLSWVEENGFILLNMIVDQYS